LNWMSAVGGANIFKAAMRLTMGSCSRIALFQA
jgi:hypothetical protein